MALLPESADSGSIVAGLTAAILVLVGGLRRAFLWWRADTRTDERGEKAADSYSAVIDQLSEQIVRLNAALARADARISALSARLDEAYMREQDKDSKLQRQTAQIIVLEERVRLLSGEAT